MVDNIIERIPPHSLEAEIAVLGSMLIDKEAVSKVLEQLTKEDFYKEAHAIIFETIKNLHLNNIPVDFVTLTEELKKLKLLDKVGGASYITSLIDLVSTSANVDHYIKIVSEKSMLRKLIKLGTTIIEESYIDKKSSAEVLNFAASNIFNLAKQQDKRSFHSIENIVKETLDKIEKIHKHQLDENVVPTGFKVLDERLAGGLHKSNFVIVAGRPGMGKTSFVTNIVTNVALKFKIPVAVFSLEMSASELILRMLCSEAKKNLHHLRKGIWEKGDWPKLTTVAGMIASSPIYIDDSPDLNILELRTRARRLAHELYTMGQNLGLIVIDYIQRMNSVIPRDTKQQEIADISNAIKGLAKELEIPVIGVSQLSRRPEEKDRDRKPRLSDLRESGALEQDADVVIFLYIPDKKSEEQNITRIYIAKHRNGPTGEISMLFMKEYTQFVEIEQTEFEEE